MKNKIYQWHRKLSIIALVPVLFWTISGVMHPLMSNFKPKIERSFLKPLPLDKTKVKLELDSILQLHQIPTLINFRFVTLDSEVYYQVKTTAIAPLMYFNASDGTELKDGDVHYAKQLARQFTGKDAGNITTVTTVVSHDNEYAEIFRLLPAYRVAFDRADGLRLYVDTSSDRLGTSVNNASAGWSAFFRNAHSWSFLDIHPAIRITIMLFFVLSAFLAAASGVYVYTIMWQSIRNKQKAKRVPVTRRLHRGLGIAMSFALMLFAFSASMHMLPKYTPDDRSSYNNEQVYPINNLQFSVLEALDKATDTLENLSLADFRGQPYIQQFHLGKNGKSITYTNLATGDTLADGDRQYAIYLANLYSGHPQDEVVETSLITKFGGEYGFVNKRLPVYKVQYKTDGNERLYIESSTGKLAAKVVDSEALSGFIFGYFHKYHFLDFAGKAVRDSIMVTFALGNFLVALLGMLMLLKQPKQKKKKTLLTA
ncbi:PepSY domain-containing protein [Limibacter armeniacum]|uniref:PepSY domain-containing protein n=1 Tax=Limibacter armeniacum TaxID=466084 RepID=UPI002FE635A6